MENMHKTSLLDRLKNAYRAFVGKPIGSVQFGVEVKRCDNCEHKNKSMVFYICDHKQCERCSYPMCKHTTNIEHAKNFTATRSPEGADIYDYWEEP